MEARHPALLSTGQPIVYSESAPAYFVSRPQDYSTVMSWIGHEGNLRRSTSDISASWASVMHNYEGNVGLAPYAAPGHWNDPDMLMVVLAGRDGYNNLSETEEPVAVLAVG